ncbi:hypothetical protein ACWCQS_25840 [Streptomyces sp. NPDC002076]
MTRSGLARNGRPSATRSAPASAATGEVQPLRTETQGPLTAERIPGGHRDCPETAVDRVIRIQELHAAGLHSGKIRQLLPCMRDRDGGPSAIATLRLVRDPTAERDRIDRMIADLGLPHSRLRSSGGTPIRETLDEVIPTARDA